MKEKKTVACVVLGVALVSLITAVIAGFADCLTLFIDMGKVKDVNISDGYQYVVGGLMLVAALLGASFVAVFFANKKKRFTVNLALAITHVAYCIISLIVLRILAPTFQYANYDFIYLTTEGYSIFTSYLATAITLMVSTALVFVAWVYLQRVKENEATVNQTTECVKTEEHSETAVQSESEVNK